ncbi:uncharacterized protein LOC123449392 isoform X2 [Hordeum vulgare subsp. vulgare]|uniref:uncharacterized protein LOC123449392 isoform X2 n=1 Tax=Hordeum vulgare subsp. vulgare TaxID=112509 RepID=UPI001D1A573F|nr:uncharacterized protein LOC123449392 isoform X2 [Hordeum vulgare subsp. vulgare]
MASPRRPTVLIHFQSVSILVYRKEGRLVKLGIIIRLGEKKLNRKHGDGSPFHLSVARRDIWKEGWPSTSAFQVICKAYPSKERGFAIGSLDICKL